MSNNQDFNAYLDKELCQLKRDIEPSRNLYPGIERAIAVESTQTAHNIQSHKWPTKLAAVAAAVGFLSIGWSWVADINNVTNSDPVTVMSRSFEQEKQALLVSYSDKEALTQDWQQQLRELENAERAIKMSLEHDPENPTLLQMLAGVYQQQLDLINNVHQPSWQEI